MSTGLTHDLPTIGSLPARPTTRQVLAGAAHVVGMAALVAVCAVSPAIPTPIGVPITLQTFGVLLAGLLQGARRGAAAVSLYVAAGLAGLPLLAGGAGGLGVLAGPSVGYLVAFVPAAAVAGLLGGLAGRVPARWRFAVLVGAALVAGLLVLHPIGVAGIVARTGMSWQAAFTADLVFVPGDVVKAVLAAGLAAGTWRAVPARARA